MKPNMNDMLKWFFGKPTEKEFKGPAQAFWYGFTHAIPIMVKGWKEMKEIEREEREEQILKWEKENGLV